MSNFTNLEGRQDLLNSITALEQELSAKLGKEVAVVAYSPVKYADLAGSDECIAKITELETELSRNIGKNVVLVAFSM